MIYFQLRIAAEMKVTVIIVTHNGSEWIDKCFGSIANSSIPCHIISIDNASNDNTVERIKIKFPFVEIIETGQNLGFGNANNIGLKRVLEEKSNYAFLLNQDAWVEEHTIESLVEIHKNNYDYGILAPLQLNADSSMIDKLFQKCSIAPCRELIKDSLISSGTLKELYETNFVNAACWLLPIKTIENIGGFDPLFHQYGEDDDYLNRAKAHGFKVGICPKIKIYHDRENRHDDKSFNKKVNSSFARMLVDLKNPAKPIHSKSYLIKKMFLNVVYSLLATDKMHYQVQYKAFRLLINNYKHITNHRVTENALKPHYLE